MRFASPKANRAVLTALVLLAAGLSAAHANDGAARPGDKTVAQVCSACHGAGLMGAPRIGDAEAWQKRLATAGSIDRLVESAEHGKGSMPPRGGVASLSDADLRAAIAYMLSKSGGG